MQAALLPHLAANARLYGRRFAPSLILDDITVHEMAALPMSLVSLCSGAGADVEHGVQFVAEFADELLKTTRIPSNRLLSVCRAAGESVLCGIALLEEEAQGKAQQRAAEAAQRRGRPLALDPGKLAEEAR